MGNLHKTLSTIEDRNIKGFEPKEHIITLHAHDRIPDVDRMIPKLERQGIYSIWNGEAYDFGVIHDQTKAVGINAVMEILKVKQQSVLAIGDNLNDKEMLSVVGIAVTADKSRVEGDFWIPLEGIHLPADVLMQQIIQVMNG